MTASEQKKLDNEFLKEKHQRYFEYGALAIVFIIVLSALRLLFRSDTSQETTKWASLTLTTALGAAGGYLLKGKTK